MGRIFADKLECNDSLNCSLNISNAKKNSDNSDDMN